MKLVLVTGKSGSGKSTFAKLLAKELGFKYFDVDCYAHKIYEQKEFLKVIETNFTKDIYSDGVFDRKKLGHFIFSQTDDVKQKFNMVTWQKMKQLLDVDIQNKNVVLDYAFLTKTEYFALDAVKILVKCSSDDVRLNQIAKRDNIDRVYLEKREKNQLQFDESAFDYVVINNYELNSLQQKAKSLASLIKESVWE